MMTKRKKDYVNIHLRKKKTIKDFARTKPCSRKSSDKKNRSKKLLKLDFNKRIIEYS